MREKGICFYCKESLDFFDGSFFKIHHKIFKKTCFTKEDWCSTNRKVKVCFFHRHCYKNLNSNVDYARSKSSYPSHDSIPK
jgi:hypothetical protein